MSDDNIWNVKNVRYKIVTREISNMIQKNDHEMLEFMGRLLCAHQERDPGFIFKYMSMIHGK